MKRRKFSKLSSAAGLAMLLGNYSCHAKDKSSAVGDATLPQKKDPFFKLSLAQWSLNKEIRNGELDPFDFAKKANELGFAGVEYVSGLYYDWIDKQGDNGMQLFGDRILEESEKYGVENLLIMIDNIGDLGIQDADKRQEGIENHKAWIDMAKRLGCHSIRLNLFGDGSYEEQLEASADSMKQLGTYGASKDIHVLIENHGGLSSDPDWVIKVLKKAGVTHIGTLPDFGNFCIEREGGARWSAPCVKEYTDYYDGVAKMMPYAKAVSAKSYNFDENGDETKIDYKKMLQVVKSAGYTGYIGVEYEGDEHGDKGSVATKDLLLKYA